MPLRKLSWSFIICFLVFSHSVKTEEVPRLGARYNYKYYDCQIEGNRFAVETKIKLTIYNNVGEDYRYVTLSESDFIKIKNVKIRVVNSSGKTVYEKGQKDMTKFCGYDGSSLYSDICHYQIELRCNQFPYSIEYEFVHEFESLFFWRGIDFQTYIPIDTIEYNIAAPSFFKYRHKVYGGKIDYTVRAKDDRQVETFYAAHVPELEKIDYLPPGARAPLSIKFAAETFEMEGYRLYNLSWDGIGDWYSEMAYGKYTMLQSTLPSASLGERISEAYNNVIENVRYVAIEIGLGGWQPYEAGLTEKRGFGDCKDMATLLTSKLNNSGVTSYPAIVLTKDEGPIDIDFPQIDFNHVIAMAVDGLDTTWMDATCNSCPLGDLPSNDEDIDVLVVTPQGGVICRTPSSTSYDNRELRKISLFVREDLRCEVELTKTGYGNYGRYLRSRFTGANNEEIRNYLNIQLPGGSNKYELLDYEVFNLEDIYQPIKFTAKYRSKKEVDKLGPNLYVDPFLFNKPGGRETLDLEGRRYPIKVIYPYAEIDTVVVTWDATHQFSQFKLPSNDSLVASFGHLKTNSTADTVSIMTTFDKAYYNYQIDPNEFEELAGFNQKLKDVTSKHIKLSK